MSFNIYESLLSKIHLLLLLLPFQIFICNAHRLTDLQNLGRDAVFKSLMFSTDLEMRAGLNTDCALKDNIWPLQATLRRLILSFTICFCNPALQIHLVLVQGDH